MVAAPLLPRTLRGRIVYVCLSMCEKEAREREEEVILCRRIRTTSSPPKRKEKKRRNTIHIVTNKKQKINHEERRFRFRCYKIMFKACTHTLSLTHIHTPDIYSKDCSGEVESSGTGFLLQHGRGRAAAVGRSSPDACQRLGPGRGRHHPPLRSRRQWI